jgi:hypothetical protein
MGASKKATRGLFVIGRQGSIPAVRKSMSQATKKVARKEKKPSLNEYKENPLTEIFLRRSSVPTEV